MGIYPQFVWLGADSQFVKYPSSSWLENNRCDVCRHGAFSGSDTEATLDGQYIAGTAPNNTQYWWTEQDWCVALRCCGPLVSLLGSTCAAFEDSIALRVHPNLASFFIC